MNHRKLIVGAALLSLVAWSGWLHADGKEVFDKNCKACHGADAKGTASMATAMKIDASNLDLTKAATKGKADADLTKIVTDGKEGTKMIGFGKKLDATQIQDVVKFIKTLP